MHRDNGAVGENLIVGIYWNLK